MGRRPLEGRPTRVSFRTCRRGRGARGARRNRLRPLFPETEVLPQGPRRRDGSGKRRVSGPQTLRELCLARGGGPLGRGYDGASDVSQTPVPHVRPHPHPHTHPHARPVRGLGRVGRDAKHTDDQTPDWVRVSVWPVFVSVSVSSESAALPTRRRRPPVLLHPSGHRGGTSPGTDLGSLGSEDEVRVSPGLPPSRESGLVPRGGRPVRQEGQEEGWERDVGGPRLTRVSRPVSVRSSKDRGRWVSPTSTPRPGHG